MEQKRKEWNERHKALTGLLGDAQRHEEAVALFLGQHALVHDSGAVAEQGAPTFADVVLSGTSEEELRHIPVDFKETGNPVAWHLWHIARIEDITLSMLIAGEEQLLVQDGWRDKLGVAVQDTGNGMESAALVLFSRQINIPQLLAYRQAVARRTRLIVQGMTPQELNRKVDPARLQRVLAAGAVRPDQQWLIDYWSGKKLSGYLLMPATRHNYVHLYRSLRLVERLRKRGIIAKEEK